MPYNDYKYKLLYGICYFYTKNQECFQLITQKYQDCRKTIDKSGIRNYYVDNI